MHDTTSNYCSYVSFTKNDTYYTNDHDNPHQVACYCAIGI